MTHPTREQIPETLLDSVMQRVSSLAGPSVQLSERTARRRPTPLAVKGVCGGLISRLSVARDAEQRWWGVTYNNDSLLTSEHLRAADTKDETFRSAGAISEKLGEHPRCLGGRPLLPSSPSLLRNPRLRKKGSPRAPYVHCRRSLFHAPVVAFDKAVKLSVPSGLPLRGSENPRRQARARVPQRVGDGQGKRCLSEPWSSV